MGILLETPDVEIGAMASATEPPVYLQCSLNICVILLTLYKIQRCPLALQEDNNVEQSTFCAIVKLLS